ncbi:MAG: zinc ribbon domain-containing protein [Chloroflexi bacterium]|nr:zinc ribbon domain-containing protein [Chloroflexota bacterium]
MPIYEYRCQSCAQVSSIFFKVASAATDVNCEHCGDYGMERIMSSFSRGRTEADTYRDLDPRYYKMVDDALGKAPSTTEPDHYLRKMAPFSSAEKTGDPYFRE